MLRYTIAFGADAPFGLGTLPRSETEPAVAVPWLSGMKSLFMLRPAFGRTDSSRIFFFFRAAGFFSRIFSPDFFSSFLWEKVPRKILQENPRENPPKFIQQKSSNTFLQIGRGNLCVFLFIDFSLALIVSVLMVDFLRFIDVNAGGLRLKRARQFYT